jgi:hypothetical protein
VEIAYRLTRLEISLEPAPDFCTYADNERQGNAFSEMFGTDFFGNALYLMMIDMMSQPFADGQANLLLQLWDMEDTSANTPDPLVTVGLSMGELAADDWESRTDKLDFPITINSVDVDDQNLPISRNQAEVVMEDGKTYVRTTAPSTVVYRSPAGDFILYNHMAEFEVDAPRSPLTPPPETAGSIAIPESMGQNDAETAQGVICGAMPMDAFRSIGMPAEVALLCGMSFTPCAAGQDPTTGECDSILTLFQEGCGILMGPAGELDADTDGDGVNDAYSSVVRASAKRIKLAGVADPN